MAAEDFANFTGGVQDATDALGDFSDALGEAGESAEDEAGLLDLDLPEELGGGRGGGGGLIKQILGGDSVAAEPVKHIAHTLLGIASSGLPPGVGTVLTKAVGSKL